MDKPRTIIPIQPIAAGADGRREEMVSLYEAQPKIYPREVSGWFTRWRWALVALTQLVFYGLPWLNWNGRPAMLFDLGTRRFYLFDLVLYPQDFIYLTVLLIISAYGLFLFTAVAGRLWCGYACPQTVYTELFLWIERRWEGDRGRRMKLDRPGWTFEKLWRKSGKHASWLLLSFWTGFSGLLHAHPHLVAGDGHVGHGPLGAVLDGLLRPGHLRQRRLHARAGVQVHVPLCALSERHVRP